MMKDNPTVKTKTNPKGGGRIRGKKYPHLSLYPGILWEQRLAYLRMRAQAKYRKELFTLTWEDFQAVWQGRWHLRGSYKGSYGMTRINWQGPWSRENVIVELRDIHWQRQHNDPTRKPRGLNKNKNAT